MDGIDEAETRLPIWTPIVTEGGPSVQRQQWKSSRREWIAAQRIALFLRRLLPATRLLRQRGCFPTKRRTPLVFPELARRLHLPRFTCRRLPHRPVAAANPGFLGKSCKNQTSPLRPNLWSANCWWLPH